MIVLKVVIIIICEKNGSSFRSAGPWSFHETARYSVSRDIVNRTSSRFCSILSEKMHQITIRHDGPVRKSINWLVNGES